jgi:site-specific DNA recombinase
MTSFAFCGRVSTEDQQDPESSRGWQLARARALTAPHGEIVAEYFDVGQSRSLPWKRRPEASRLLDSLKDPRRGFDAVVIGEPHRAFYGNQFSLTFPLFEHYGVALWVPEVGGPIDPTSEAHDLIMSVFGGMSKGERSRIKIYQDPGADRDGRAGQDRGAIPRRSATLRLPHHRGRSAPEPGQGGRGRPVARPGTRSRHSPGRVSDLPRVRERTGPYVIAEGLTADGIPSPSAYDPKRNRHRCGIAWSKPAVRAILANPRYTGWQVWNKQRKDEVLIDVDDVALGHQTRMRWNDPDAWLYSTAVEHTPLVDDEMFRQVQARLAAKKADQTGPREPKRSPHSYQLRGRMHCGICQRRIAGQLEQRQAPLPVRLPGAVRAGQPVAAPAQHLRPRGTHRPGTRPVARPRVQPVPPPRHDPRAHRRPRR